MNLKLKRILAGAMSGLMAVSFAGCTSNGKIYEYKASDYAVSETAKAGKATHTSVKDGFELITSSSLLELYYDKTTCSVAVKDTSKGKIWYSLPDTENDEASAVTVTILDKDTEKLTALNSQDNSVAFKTASAKKITDGVAVTYKLKDKEKNASVEIDLTLKYTLSDGSFHVDIDCADPIKEGKNIVIENIAVLPYFGATKEAVSGDFMLVPDGCGALIHLDTQNDDKDYSFKTYGSDYSVGKSSYKDALTAVCGKKNSTSAFVAMVFEGDAISNTMAKTSSSGYDRVYFDFDITANNTEKTDDTVSLTTADESYNGKISVCYRFVSGSTATYASMASICREQFIREGFLSTKEVESEDELPVVINLIGSSKNGVSNKVYTNFEDALEIVTLLKSKGIDNMDVNYLGAFDGGITQESISTAGLNSKLGSRSNYLALYDFMNAQNFKLCLSANIITSVSNGAKADNALGRNFTITIDNDADKYIESSPVIARAVRIKSLESYVIDFMSRMKNYSFSGFSINDAGKYLYSDYRGKYINRQEASEIIASQITALSSDKFTIVEHGNLYSVKSADLVTDIPLTTGYKESDSYEAVPFAQLMLHGMLDYTGSSLNLTDDYNQLFLKSIEYGALPSFEIMFEDLAKGDEGCTVCYDEQIGNIYDAYVQFNDTFADLRSARMTGHKKISEGFYCTQYSDSTYVYVNYTDEAITYNSLSIPAKGYLRVN